MHNILNRLLIMLVLATSAATVAGCGQMGPLYLPAEEPDAIEAEEAAADAPDVEELEQ